MPRRKDPRVLLIVRRVNILVEQQQMLEEMHQAMGEELSSKEDREAFQRTIRERTTLLTESAHLRAFTSLYGYPSGFLA